MTDGELKVLAEWMDAGGGVFATGDHAYLGASMCSSHAAGADHAEVDSSAGGTPREGSTATTPISR